MLQSGKIKVEPYWNVKQGNGPMQMMQQFIKVELYWNVKDIKTERWGIIDNELK